MQKNRKYEIGYVTSDKMDKTVVVSIVELVRHPYTQKLLKRQKNTRRMMRTMLARLATE